MTGMIANNTVGHRKEKSKHGRQTRWEKGKNGNNNNTKWLS